MTGAATAGLLALTGLWAGMISVMLDLWVRNQGQDIHLAWRRSFGAFLSFGGAWRGLAVQAVLARVVTLTFFAASLFIALHALFVE